MCQIETIVTLPPGEERRLRGLPVTAAHLAYRAGRGPRLLRAGNLPGRPGGLMVVGQGDYSVPGNPAPFCQEVLRECLTRGYSGAVLDFDLRLPFWEQLAGRLDELLFRKRLRLFVPEAYGFCAPHAGVMVSSALSGGTLTGRLEEVGERFGRDRVALCLERSAEDFTLPSPTGCGRPLTGEELHGMLDRMRPCVFFSTGLCARYFTYMTREGGAHFVLFDDADTLRRKRELAVSQGFRRFFLNYTDLEALRQTASAIDGGVRPG